MEIIERLKELLSRPTLTKSEKTEIVRLAKKYGIELECTTCQGRYTKAIIEIVNAIQEEMGENPTEILKPQFQKGVFIGNMFICEQNAKQNLSTIKKYAPNLLNNADN